MKSLGPEIILGYMFYAKFDSLKELCSSGKSGSFSITSDGNFMLKTIHRDEFKTMKDLQNSILIILRITIQNH